MGARRAAAPVEGSSIGLGFYRAHAAISTAAVPLNGCAGLRRGISSLPSPLDSFGMDDLGQLPESLERYWIPVRIVGKGGGGTVYLSVRRDLVDVFDRFGERIKNRALNQSGAPLDPLLNRAVPGLIDKIFSAVRERSGVGAVKVPIWDPPQPGDMERFRREIEAMKACDHPGLIRIYDSDPSPTPRWLAAEYHPRGTLDEEANRKLYLGRPLSILTDVRPLADALASLHQRDMIHRDIKPKNIFVADDGRLVLGDFGIVIPSPDAEPLTGIEPAHSRDWVPDWVRFGDERHYTEAVDTFALAKVIYYLLTGKNVMASQIGVELEALEKGLPRVPGMMDTLALLEKCIVTLEKNVTIHNGEQLRNEIDAILKNASALKGHLVFSFLSIGTPTHCRLENAYDMTLQPPQFPPVKGLDELSVYVPRPTTEFTAMARMAGTNGVIGFQIGDLVSSNHKFPGAGNHAQPGVWTGPLHLKGKSPVPAGWQTLRLVGAGRETDLTAFSLYAL
jgi:serine/threonine protein kinase